MHQNEEKIVDRKKLFELGKIGWQKIIRFLGVVFEVRLTMAGRYSWFGSVLQCFYYKDVGTILGLCGRGLI